MKILILCPGSWSHGLNSPERGEGRWSQNYARMLAKAGHDVYAASMNIAPDEDGVKLINEVECSKYEPYDLYIDSSWWKDKVPKAKATKYIALKWSLEDYTREPITDSNFYLAYPYPSHRWEFSGTANDQKTFPLPTMFGEDFPEPNWPADKIFLPGKIDINRRPEEYIDEVAAFLNKHPIEGCTASFFQKEFKGLLIEKEGDCLYESKPYNEVLESMKNSRISVPILNPGCIIEAAFQGVPSIFWGHSGFYNPLASSLDILIEHDAPPGRFTEVAESIMYNKKRHAEVVIATQDYFSCHLYDRAMKYFNLMVEEIFED